MADLHDVARVLGLYFLHLERHRVFVDALRVFDRTHDVRRVTLCPLDQRLLDVGVDGRLGGGHEARAHVHARRPQAERGGELATVAAAATHDEGHAQLARGERQKQPVSHLLLARVAGALEAVHRDDVGAQALCGEGVAHGDTLVDDDEAGGLELLDPFSRVAAGGLHHADALADDDVGVRAVVRRRERGQQRQVHAERL
mmetsp:Transcript_13568/g.56777  ORF Transcript_13568/g.56777 Transcript_13568/m.56777 type:complete len:200 (-) Transcript_13568:329-928(-)